jgi:hypothetical protein
MAEEQLHDRATRGQPVSADERAQLQAWYARLDGEEAAKLDQPAPPAELAQLHIQIETSLAELGKVTQRVQTLTSENATLRREIAVLESQLPQKPTAQPA